MNIRTIEVYRKGLKVERLHTIPHLTPYNNGFHSANAALIARDLCVYNDIAPATTMYYMLLHDVAEGYTGDLPANVKVDNPEMAAMLDRIEDNWAEIHIPHMPDLAPIEKRVAKVSDLAELGMYCLEELILGNKGVILVLTNVVEYLQNYTDVKGCQEFITHFVSRGELK